MNLQATELDALKLRLQQRLAFLQQDPDNGKLFVDTVDLAISLADWACVETLLQHAPASLGAALTANYRATVYIATHRPDLAVQTLLPFLDTESGHLEQVMRCNAAYALALMEDGVTAEQILRKIPLAAMNDDARRLLLHVLMLQGEIDEAVQLGLAYWQAGGRDPAILGLYALAMTDIGLYEEAVPVARQALLQGENENENENALCATGMSMMATDSAAAAQTWFERALRQEARHGRAWLGLGMCRLVANDLQGGKDALLQATRFNSQHPGSWHALGWAWLGLNDIGQAEAAFNNALKADRNFGDTHGALAVVAVARGNLEDAEHFAAVALRLDPRSLAGNYAKALLSEARGDPRQAQAMISSLLNSQLGNGFTLAEAATRMRRT